MNFLHRTVGYSGMAQALIATHKKHEWSFRSRSNECTLHISLKTSVVTDPTGTHLVMLHTSYNILHVNLSGTQI